MSLFCGLANTKTAIHLSVSASLLIKLAAWLNIFYQSSPLHIIIASCSLFQILNPRLSYIEI